MPHSLLFEQEDEVTHFVPLTSAPKHPQSGAQYTKGQDRLAMWINQQTHQSTHLDGSLSEPTHQDDSEYTFTAQAPNDPTAHLHLFTDFWNPAMALPSSWTESSSSGHMSNARLSSSPVFTEDWSQLSHYSTTNQDHSLALTSPYLNYSQESHVSNNIGSYGTSAATLTTPTTPSDPSLSPLSGYSTSPQLPTPTTPVGGFQQIASPSSAIDMSGLLLIETPGQSNSSNSDKKQYTHREQLGLFRDATTLPLDGAGPFVPQMMYKPHTTSDLKRYVEEVLLEPPLYFESDRPSQYGISLKDALHSRTKKLANRDVVVFEGRGPSVSIRLEWPGYRQWSRQIPTKDFRSPPGPITLGKLAKNVAKCVQRFMQDRKVLPLEDEADHRWRVGDGPDDIKLDDLVLVSIHHVSLGSWQPHLRLIRPRPQRFPQRPRAQGVQVHSQTAAAAAASMGPTMLPLHPTPMSINHTMPRQNVPAGRGTAPPNLSISYAMLRQ